MTPRPRTNRSSRLSRWLGTKNGKTTTREGGEKPVRYAGRLKRYEQPPHPCCGVSVSHRGTACRCAGQGRRGQAARGPGPNPKTTPTDDCSRRECGVQPPVRRGRV